MDHSRAIKNHVKKDPASDICNEGKGLPLIVMFLWEVLTRPARTFSSEVLPAPAESSSQAELLLRAHSILFRAFGAGFIVKQTRRTSNSKGSSFCYPMGGRLKSCTVPGPPIVNQRLVGPQDRRPMAASPGVPLYSQQTFADLTHNLTAHPGSNVCRASGFSGKVVAHGFRTFRHDEFQANLSQKD